MAQTDLKTDIWRSEGPWLVLVLLPLAALAFRRGWLLSLPLLVVTVLSSAPQPAMAASWDDLWQRRDQQADAALRAGDLQRAQALARQPQRLGTAAYRAGDYDKALQAFARSEGPQGDYNRANALAQLGRYQDAIAAYDKALKADPGLDDAVYNKAQVEKLLQQQKQKQQQSKNSSGQGKKDTKQQQAGNSSQQQDGGGKQASGNKSRSSTTAGNSGKSAQTGKQPGQPGSDEPGSGNQAQNAGDQHSPAAETPEPAVSAGKKPAATGASQARGDNTSRSSEQPRQQARAKGTPDTAGSAPQPPVQSADKGAAPGNADPLTREQQQADERWLRRIPDDPGGLLRRKFLYQYSQRERAQQNDNRQNW
jgi:Ca-activated chloride channel family protein